MAIKVKVFDDRFKELFNPQQELHVVASGLSTELGPNNTNGPVWHSKDRCLYFNDLAGSRTLKYSVRNGLELAFNNGLKSAGMCASQDGRLILCEHATSSLVIRNTDGTKRRVLADYCEDIELNGPHDVIQRSDGIIYFSDPVIARNYNVGNVYRRLPSGRKAVYMLRPDTGLVRQAASGFQSPNGLCFSPDEKILYVVDSRPGNTVRAYDVKLDGDLTNERNFITLETFSDGIKVDSAGNLLLAVPRYGLDWFSPEGKRLGFIFIPDIPMNIAWGDEDLKSLYITCKPCVYKLRTLVAGR